MKNKISPNRFYLDEANFMVIEAIWDIWAQRGAGESIA
jgi:hypothetical protein